MKRTSLLVWFTLAALSGFSQTATEQIKTLEGKAYKAARIEAVEPDGIQVAYEPEGGGVGLAKLRFQVLPGDLQRRFGYDSDRAAKYAAEQAEARLACGAQLWLEYQAAADRKAIRLAREEAEAREAERQAQIAQQEAEKQRREIEIAENIRRQTELLETAQLGIWPQPVWFGSPANTASACESPRKGRNPASNRGDATTALAQSSREFWGRSAPRRPATGTISPGWGSK